MIDFGFVPPRLRQCMPDVLAAALERHGLREASIGRAPRMGDRYDNLDRLAPLCRAWFLGSTNRDAPRIAARPRPELIELSLSWLDGEHKEDYELLALVISTEIPLPWDQRRQIIDGILGPGRRTPVLSTDFATQAACVEFGQFYGFGVCLSAGGADWSHRDLADRMHAHRDLIREHADSLARAGVTIDADDTFILHPAPQPYDAPQRLPMWYQLFSPSQIEHLGAPPAGSVELADGQIEITIGEPEHWHPDNPNHEHVINQGRALLTPRGEGL
jgi:hypothetical protein